MQSQILNLLLDLRRELGLTYLFISHNLAVVEHIATRVAVMYLGAIVEDGQTRAAFSRAAPSVHAGAARLGAYAASRARGVPDTQLGAAYPNPLDPPAGCTFHPRCARALPQCGTQAPRTKIDPAGRIACHLY